MGLSILKITGAGTGTSRRSIFRSLNSYRIARTISTVNRTDEDQVSSSSSDDSIVSSSTSPLLMLSPSSYSTSYAFYSFAMNRVFSIPKSEKTRYAIKIVGSSHGWLACFNQRRYELFLSNPLSGRRVNLPPIHNLDISRSDFIRGVGINKIIISCSDPESAKCRVMMLYKPSNRLAFCCPGISSSTEWTTIKSLYWDIVYCATHKLFFATTKNMDPDLELQAWDLRNPRSPSLVWSCGVDKLEYCSYSGEQSEPPQNDVSCSNHEIQNYLVVSQQGELFLVYRYFYPYMLPDGSCPPEEDDDLYSICRRYPPKTVNYKVFKIVREGDGGKKVYMDGHLDDQVMFVGWLSHGMAMPAADADGFQPNTICFTDDTYTDSFKEVRGNDNGIFDYKNKTFHPCYYPSDYESLRRKIMPPPLWFSPKLHGNENGNCNKKRKCGQTQK